LVTSGVSKVRKRDGSIVDFEQSRITDAVLKALVAVGVDNGANAKKKISDSVIERLNERFRREHAS